MTLINIAIGSGNSLLPRASKPWHEPINIKKNKYANKKHSESANLRYA